MLLQQINRNAKTRKRLLQLQRVSLVIMAHLRDSSKRKCRRTRRRDSTIDVTSVGTLELGLIATNGHVLVIGTLIAFDEPPIPPMELAQDCSRHRKPTHVLSNTGWQLMRLPNLFIVNFEGCEAMRFKRLSYKICFQSLIFHIRHEKTLYVTIYLSSYLKIYVLFVLSIHYMYIL